MLSDTQQQAIDLLAQGLNDAEVARRLGIRSLVVHAWRVYDSEFKQVLKRRRSEVAASGAASPPSASVSTSPASEPPAEAEPTAAAPAAEDPVATPPDIPETSPPMVTSRMASFS